MLHRFEPLAPLSLCFADGFDLKNNTVLCPIERNALKLVYDTVKGQEWTESELWLHEYASHCDWMGVSCDDSRHTIKLELQNNGLSGKLSSSVGDLTYLKVLDLSDNDIKVRQEAGSITAN